MKQLPRTAGDIVRDKREVLQLSLAALAEAIGHSDSHLSDIENNRRIPSDEMLKKICRQLRLDFNYMSIAFGRVPDPIRDAVIRCDFSKAATLVQALASKNTAA